MCWNMNTAADNQWQIRMRAVLPVQLEQHCPASLSERTRAPLSQYLCVFDLLVSYWMFYYTGSETGHWNLCLETYNITAK